MKFTKIQREFLEGQRHWVSQTYEEHDLSNEEGRMNEIERRVLQLERELKEEKERLSKKKRELKKLKTRIEKDNWTFTEIYHCCENLLGVENACGYWFEKLFPENHGYFFTDGKFTEEEIKDIIDGTEYGKIDPKKKN